MFIRILLRFFLCITYHSGVIISPLSLTIKLVCSFWFWLIVCILIGSVCLGVSDVKASRQDWPNFGLGLELPASALALASRHIGLGLKVLASAWKSTVM